MKKINIYIYIKLLLLFLLLSINNILLANIFICSTQEGKEFYTDNPNGKCNQTDIVDKDNLTKYNNIKNNKILSYNQKNKLIILEKELMNEYQALDYALKLHAKIRYNNKKKIILENEISTRKANIRLLKIEIAKIK